MARFAVFVAVVATLFPLSSPVAAAAPQRTVEHTVVENTVVENTVETASPWRHPVDAPIVDFFRPPSGPYGAGNRGLEYGTRAGQSVVAVAAGSVVFAGSVGGQRYVVVAHGPHLRSTYAYLERVDVTVGDRVVGGQPVATAAAHFHLTARLRGHYVDPLGYIGSDWSVRLVASPSRRFLVG